MDSFDMKSLANHPDIGDMARAALANEGQQFMNKLARLHADEATAPGDRAVAQASLRTLGSIMSQAGMPNEWAYNPGQVTMGNPTAFLMSTLIASDVWPTEVTYEVVKQAYVAGTATTTMRDIIKEYLYLAAGISSLTPAAQGAFK